jgi:biotin carboxyl carrier protein
VHHVTDDGESCWVFGEGRSWLVTVRDAAAGARVTGVSHHDALASPMPGTVARILTTVGAVVGRGQTLVVVEAMKMELPLRAPHDGVVTRIGCREGEMVQPGVALVDLDRV